MEEQLVCPTCGNVGLRCGCPVNLANHRGARGGRGNFGFQRGREVPVPADDFPAARGARGGRGNFGLQRGREVPAPADEFPAARGCRFHGIANSRGRGGFNSSLPQRPNSRTTEFRWTMESVHQAHSDKTLQESPIFSLINFPTSKFTLFLDWSKNINDAGFMGIVAKELDPRRVPILKIFVCLRKTYYSYSEKIHLLSVYNNQEYTFDSIHEKHFIFLENSKDPEFTEPLRFSIGSSLTLCCDLEIVDTKKRKTKHDLILKMWGLYNEDVGYDTIIKVEGQEFKVCSYIFMAQSEVFKAMLTSNMTEGKEKRVVIEDMSIETMEVFVRWMYTGCISYYDPLPELYMAADKYMIDNLKVKCFNLMIDNLTVENAAKFLAFAYTYNYDDLGQQINKYISSLSYDMHMKVFESDAWLEYLNKKKEATSE